MSSAVAELLQWVTSIIGPSAGDPRTAASVRTPLGQLASRTKWLRHFTGLLFGSEQLVTGSSSGFDTLTVTGHGLASNTAVQIYAVDGGTLPAGLSAQTVYYVIATDADTIKLSLTSGPGAAVDITGPLSGTVYVAAIQAWISSMLVADATYGAGQLKDLVVWLAGAQTVSGAKTFDGQVTLSGTKKVGLAARSKTRIIRGPWILQTGGATDAYGGITADTGEQWFAQLEVPHGAQITGLTFYVNPATHAALPGTMPKGALWTWTPSTEADDNVVEASDTSANFGAYNALHTISVAVSPSETVNNEGVIYYAKFTQESGADSAAGEFLGGAVTFIVAEYDDGAS
jgi:hypothetical protein